MTASLDSISPAPRYSRQAVAVQWLRHISSSKDSSSALALQWLAALDQGHSYASETNRALNGLSSV